MVFVWIVFNVAVVLNFKSIDHMSLEQSLSTEINSPFRDGIVHTVVTNLDIPITASLLIPLLRISSSAAASSQIQCFISSLR